MDVWIMDTCIIDEWGAGYGHGKVLVICIGHTARAAEKRERESQEARVPKELQQDVGPQQG